MKYISELCFELLLDYGQGSEIIGSFATQDLAELAKQKHPEKEYYLRVVPVKIERKVFETIEEYIESRKRKAMASAKSKLTKEEAKYSEP